MFIELKFLAFHRFIIVENQNRIVHTTGILSSGATDI